MRIDAIRKDLEAVTETPELTVGDILGLPQCVRQFIHWMLLFKAVSCEQVAAFLGESEDEAQALITELCTRGLIEHVPACGVPVYRVCLSPRRLRAPQWLLQLLDSCDRE